MSATPWQYRRLSSLRMSSLKDVFIDHLCRRLVSPRYISFDTGEFD